MHFKYLIRFKIIISLCIVTALGFYSKVYNGPAFYWVNNSLSGVLYEIFWCLFILLLSRKSPLLLISGSVFVITSGLEVLQLWHPPFLESVRQTFLGRTLVGTTFVWSDFVYYLIGCIVAYYLEIFLIGIYK